MKPIILQKIEKTREYLGYIERHYENVQKAHKDKIDLPEWAVRDLHLVFKCLSNYSLS